ncbi:ATP-binding cassette, subfamily C, exporter for protease/lipase [Rhizobium mongolense subsp. loessense]|uniref:ATP-binding cassette, subfamily C, exporter for protease/lipase n=1 Tax=Rhizobium mongolense subsp. loessense TaxID=158890 RepID=A0A1G4SNI2_9HYPH|nr:type I secretion system permease/ATPase [Rhizobium mongolense]SCW70713.1 ATP-binding cassette, subfamily C, exporter for protease/lipase [Rhizobium mongolense subsp. loessense]
MLPQVSTTRLAEVMGAIRRQFPLLIVLSCLLNLLLLVTSIYMLQVYDRVLSSGSLDTLMWLTLIAIFAVAVYGMLEQARRMVLGRAAGWLDTELNAPMLKRAMEVRLAGKDGPAGTRDVADLRAFYGGDAVLAFFDMPWSVIFLVFIWALHPALGVVATAGAVILLALALANDALTRSRQKRVAAVTKTHQENAMRYVDAGETIAPLGMARAVFDRWRRRQAEVVAEQQLLGDRTTTILSISRSLRMILQIAILTVGAYFVLLGEITAGAMIAGSIVMGRALAPIERATSAWRSLVAARSALANLTELFAGTSRDERDRVSLPRPKGGLVFDNVLYLPPGTQEPLLTAISFALEPGENCVVVGPSGAGKSTLCRLAVGAWKPTKGHVRLDAADVFDWDSEDLGPHIGYLPQQVELLPGTVAQNIARFGEANSNALIRAAQIAGVHDLILSLPNGYETEIALHSQRISLGQRQRLGLARALYGDPAFVVLDEPNANMDEAGDRALIEALTTLKQLQTTVLIVTHRASVLKCADKVLALHGGAVAAFGPREQMVRPVQPTGPAVARPLPACPPEEPSQVPGRETRLSAGE